VYSLDPAGRRCGPSRKPALRASALTSWHPGKVVLGRELEAAGPPAATPLYRAAMGGIVLAAREVEDKDTFGHVGTSLPSAELASIMPASERGICLVLAAWNGEIDALLAS